METELFIDLTPRQFEVADYVRRGFSDKEIAAFLGVSINTIKTHLKTVYKTLNISGRVELAGLSEWHDTGRREYQTLPRGTHQLGGLWLSRFRYRVSRNGKSADGVQYNLECLEEYPGAQAEFNITGENLLQRNSMGTAYQHKLKAFLHNTQLIGVWANKNSNNAGCFQLHVQNNGNLMYGRYLGNTGDNSIQGDEWHWVRIDSRFLNLNVFSRHPERWNLLPQNELEEAFESWFMEAKALDVSLVTKIVAGG